MTFAVVRDNPDAAADFTFLYRDLRPRLVRTAYLILGSLAEAEEHVQDAFVELHARYETVNNPSAYLRVVVVRSCLRANARRRSESDALTVLTDPIVPEPQIDEMLVALRHLRPDRRTILVLRYYDDLSHAEISRTLGCSVVTARARVRRALVDLRRELDR